METDTPGSSVAGSWRLGCSAARLRTAAWPGALHLSVNPSCAQACVTLHSEQLQGVSGRAEAEKKEQPYQWGDRVLFPSTTLTSFIIPRLLLSAKCSYTCSLSTVSIAQTAK